MAEGPSLGARTGMRAIRGYRRVMAGTTPRCRFAPSCSEYTHTAIEIYGLGRGSWMGLKRVGRCHPWNPGGYDPVSEPNVRSVSGR
ncbi:MAG: membrane protein insertion efficiency factor YidD [Acidimicrobiia bacterium]